MGMVQPNQQGVAEGVPQPGKSSGKPISWIDPTKVVTKYLTLDEIFKSVSGIPYYNNVVTDRDNKDFTWGVTKRVIQYAKELVIRPDAYKNWPPIIVLDGKLQDGAHRISTIYLMQQRVQPNNPIWKNAKLKVEFGTSDNVKQGLAEGDVVPFKQPSKTLTWDQVPRDILLLANDWFWASEDNSGLDATIDPEGYGNGTANDVKYLSAKLQQKGWTIDFNDEYDAPGEFNLRLTNKRGQTVLLSIEDAQDFTGWAKGTNPVSEGPFVQRITHPKKVSIYLRLGKGSKLIATDIPYEILDRYIDKVVKKYPQFKQTDFSFKDSAIVDEGLGIPYPGTYEQDNEMTKTKGGQMRTLAIANESNLSESVDYLEEK
jgi:hypothetical protein